MDDIKDIKRYDQLRKVYGDEDELIELLDLHFKIGTDGLVGGNRETIEYEMSKLMGILELKKILLDKTE